MSKVKLAYYSLMPSDSTAWYRSSAILPFIKHPDIELTDISEIRNFNWSTLIKYTHLFMQRPFTKEHVDLLTLAKDLGLYVITDYDDDLYSINQENPTYSMYQAQQATLTQCINLSDEVWVSTESIKQSIPNRNVHVIPNAHNDYLHKVKDKKPFNDKGKKVYWRGGGSHEADVNTMAEELVKVITENPDWNFQFHGGRHSFIEQRCGDNYHIIPSMTIPQYFKYLYQENPQIGIFPLQKNKFNEGKSNISWIEMTYAGAAFFGNEEMPEFNNEYITSISRLGTAVQYFEMAELRYQNEMSWKYICENLLLSDINKLRIERLLAKCPKAEIIVSSN